MLCEFEDSRNCICIAQLQGNKGGNSFIDVMGTPLYAEELVFIAILAIVMLAIALIIFDRN